MKKALKIICIIVTLLIATVIALPFIFKGKIIQKIKDESNKNLNAKMDFASFDVSIISTFPDFKFTLNKFYLAGIKEFEGDTLISLNTLEINVNFMSVINGSQYKINSILLDHPTILAKILKDGKFNWDITKLSAASAPATSESSPFKMTLKKFEIIEGNIVYDDASLDFFTAVKKMNYTLSGDFTEVNFTMKTNTSIEQLDMVYAGVKYLNKVKTTIKADLEADMPNFKFTFKENKFNLNELSFGLDGWFAMPKEDMDMDLKFDAKKASFKSFLSLIPGIYTKDFADVKTSGNLAFNGYAKGTYNDKLIPAFGLKVKIDNAMFKYPSLPKSVNNIFVDVNISNKDGKPDNTIIDLNKLHLEMGANPVDVKMHVSTPASDPNIDGDIKAKIDLASVKEFIPLESDQSLNGTIISDIALKGRMSSIDKKEYEKFIAKGQIIVMDLNYKSKDTPYGILLNKMYMNFTPQLVEISQFSAKIGKSDVNAKGKLDNFLAYFFKDETLKGEFSMNSNLMDLNEFMGEPETAATPAAADTMPMSIVEVPSNIDLTLTSAFNMLIYDNIEIKNVSGGVKIKESKITLDNLKMNLLDGSMVMNGIYATTNPKQPQVDMDLNITNFDIHKTHKTFQTIDKLAHVSQYTTGKFSTALKLSTALDSKMEPVLTTLNGTGSLQTSNIVISGYEPLVKIADALKMDKYKRMDLNNVDITYEFKDGRVFVKPFDIKAGNSNVNIAGSSGFDQTLDFKMIFEILRSDFGDAANSVLTGLLSKANIKGANFTAGNKVKVEVLVTGTSSKPIIKTGLKDAAKGAIDDLKDKAKEELDKKKKELEDKARAEGDKAKAEAEARARAEADKLKAQGDKAKAEAEAKAKAEAERLKKEAEAKVKKEAENKLKGILKKK